MNSARKSSGERIWKFRFGPGLKQLALRVGEGPASVLLGLVDHLPGLGHLDQPREAERAAGHVLHQPLDARPVAGRQVAPTDRR